MRPKLMPKSWCWVAKRLAKHWKWRHTYINYIWRQSLAKCLATQDCKKLCFGKWELWNSACPTKWLPGKCISKPTWFLDLQWCHTELIFRLKTRHLLHCFKQHRKPNGRRVCDLQDPEWWTRDLFQQESGHARKIPFSSSVKSNYFRCKWNGCIDEPEPRR